MTHRRGTGSPLSREAGALVMVAVGAVATAASVTLVAGSDVLTHPHSNAAARGLAVALCTAVGAYTWWQRPESRLGLLVTGIGLSFSLTSLIALTGPVPFTLGRATTAGFVVLTVYVFVCFPRDRLAPGPAAWFVHALVVMTAVLWGLALALTDELPVGGPVAQCSGPCPRNAFQLVSAPEPVSDALAIAVNALSALGLVGATAALVAKARSPDRLRRRAVEPLLWVMSLVALSYAVYLTLRQAGVAGSGAPGAIAIAGFLAMPIGILIGQIRGRVFAATKLARMVAAAGSVAVTPERVERLISDALGDPTLTLLLWSVQCECYLDVRGLPVPVPGDAVERTILPVRRDGRPVAAVIHDPGLDQAQEITEGIAATALMLLDNTRLVEELRASRARIAETAQDERARLERDLHDGAQQRLMAIQIKLSLVREAQDPGERDALLDELEDDATAAVEELRTLAQGIFPPVLRDRGLADALRSAALRAPMAVSVRCRGRDRYPAATEAAVYFSVLEAMQNALKHSPAGAHLDLSLDCAGAGVSFAVADDGTGFDVELHATGIGLISMRDRMAAVGGALTISSHPGSGTTVSGRAPARQDQER
jgi:signal transduction histidine kinase